MMDQHQKMESAKDIKVRKAEWLQEIAVKFFQADAEGKLQKVSRPSEGKIVLSR